MKQNLSGIMGVIMLLPIAFGVIAWSKSGLSLVWMGYLTLAAILFLIIIGLVQEGQSPAADGKSGTVAEETLPFPGSHYWRVSVSRRPLKTLRRFALPPASLFMFFTMKRFSAPVYFEYLPVLKDYHEAQKYVRKKLHTPCIWMHGVFQ
jgi:hypothetical protein